MMWGDGYGIWWMWIPGFLLALLILGGIAFIVVLAVRMTGSQHTHGTGGDPARPAPGEAARRILEDRLARGEISVEEYRERVRALDEHIGPSSREAGDRSA